ncbi:Gfo/Idh/MocA family protein [Halorussus pelagicus]|uniref:Gfo/Idh/MocA family protein n=1 Tax=Halorussus pelagicus TaxID=2505977 RepID=UPI000FFC54E5|nr:Gfo/Idh/MocA family oxidoreductase [Halorussus pelagicus]
MHSEISVGVVGCGTLGERLAKQVAGTVDGQITAVTDVNEESAQALASQFGLPAEETYSDYTRMYSEADLDAVIITTPHCFHYEQIMDALELDLDILTEKPLVTDLDEAFEISEKADRSESMVMVGFQRRIQSVFKRARERYQTTPPEIRYIDATLTEHWLELKDGTWRTDLEYSGGGFFTDAVRHLIDAILWVTGLTPTKVDATMDFYREGIESSGVMTIHFDNGAKATITGFADARTIREEYYFCDEDGSLLIEGHGWDESERKTLKIVDGDTWDRTQPHLQQHSDPGKGEVFIECLQTGREPPASIENSVKMIELIQAARDSAMSGEIVHL